MAIILDDCLELLGVEEVFAEQRSVSEHSIGAAERHGCREGDELIAA
jgi:hypothetical protein